MAHRTILKQEHTFATTERETTREEDFPRWVRPGRSFALLTGCAQLAFLVIFYKRTNKGVPSPDMDSGAQSCYIGVTLMTFLGFGYLKAFLKAYGLGAVGFTMLIACLGLQWAIILDSLAHQSELAVDFPALLNGNMAVATVLVSFGALIGRISPTQIVMLVLIELSVYTVNKVFVVHQFDVRPHLHDGGGTIMVHVFGAYFGLAASLALGPAVKDRLRCSSYQSDIFSLIGTIFLWMFWPTFVAAGQETAAQQSKAFVNTVLALLTSTVTTFGFTQILQDGKIGTQAVQNATLAGGVTIGASAGIVGPFGAGALGMAAGALSTVAFARLPFFRAIDTCGIHNLHGLPGILGGAFSAFSPLFYSDTGIAPFDQMLSLCSTLLLALFAGFLCGLAFKAVEELHDDKDLRRAASEVGLDPSDLQIEPFSDAAFWVTGDGQPDVPVIEL
ncbi:Ammonium transporter Rh type A (Erythrocyte membrane glycoprotein Rh50) (Rhesus blood group family type A glycoprotein) (Rh family type A glycoprotein) (Rh type A glycoprotein) (CD antigen CD241) [Durusdinium trenchii]|uniref:Ammonium transporter Rh type A (Erythrocyte membrane glycoprotein Rh50) (Rhesus blood group family type A glycoprotein) (Rh family type A glycoprotein) (Rh type A glycoprotein) (CD antigen CD241) n=1 Tax=Durusdinium trenchii TaxID=1381693 RepID=A0ABP0IIP7_9DINO